MTEDPGSSTVRREVRLFVSYAREDQATVRELISSLTELNCRVWFDQVLMGGQAWWDTIVEEIRACDGLVVALSSRMAVSNACLAEFSYARKLDRAILPVLVDAVDLSTLPDGVSAFQAVDLTSDSRASGLKLAAAVSRIVPGRPLPAELPSPPPTPKPRAVDLIERAAAETLSRAQQLQLVGELETKVRNSLNEAATVARVWHKRTDVDPNMVARLETLLGSSAPTPPSSSASVLMSKVDFLPASWLTRGAEAADAVAMLTSDDLRGTGFLVSNWLLLTAHHLLPKPVDASEAIAIFRYVVDDDNRISDAREVRLDPARCFLGSPIDELDYTLVAVAPLADGRAPGEVFGVIPVSDSGRRPVVDDPVNIISYPEGRPREIAVRNNQVTHVSDHRVSYQTDVQHGSSGSPILNDDWGLIAIHSRTSGDSSTARRSRKPARVRNIGVRIEPIVADIQRRIGAESDETTDLVAELLAAGRPDGSAR